MSQSKTGPVKPGVHIGLILYTDPEPSLSATTRARTAVKASRGAARGLNGTAAACAFGVPDVAVPLCCEDQRGDLDGRRNRAAAGFTRIRKRATRSDPHECTSWRAAEPVAEPVREPRTDPQNCRAEEAPAAWPAISGVAASRSGSARSRILVVENRAAGTVADLGDLAEGGCSGRWFPNLHTKVLGFEKKTEVPPAEHRWLTVVSPDEPEGTELVLEPDSHPAAKPFQAALVSDGIPFTSR